MNLLLAILMTVKLLETEAANASCVSIPKIPGCNEIITYKWKKGLHQTPINLSCIKDNDNCTVSSMKWSFGDKILDPKSSSEYKEGKTKGNLTLTNPNKRFAGRYKLVTDIATCYVCLKASPVVLLDSSHGEQERQYHVGDTLKLHEWFNVLGWSPEEQLMVTWYRDGKELMKGGSKHIVIEDGDNGILNEKLTIKGLLKSDQGRYTCKASSKKMGKSNQKEIHIYVKSSIEVFIPLIGLAAEVVLFLICMLINKKLTEMKKKRRDKKIKAILDKYLAQLEEDKKRRMEISVGSPPVVIPSTVPEEPTIQTGESRTEVHTESSEISPKEQKAVTSSVDVSAIDVQTQD